MSTDRQPVPVTVLTGFLGAGKTTLLNRILTEEHGRRIAVIENEFGEVGIDHELVVNADEEIFEMNNGCICCTVRGDLIRILGTLMRRRDRFDRILIETTGMAEPGPVAQTFFVDDEMQEQLRLDAIVTVVDARHVEQHAGTDEVQTQIAFADVVLLNKADLVEPADLRRVEERIRAINSQAAVHRTVRGEVPLEAVLDVGGFDLRRALETDPQFMEPEYPFEWGGLYELAAGEHALVLDAGPDPAMEACLVPAQGLDEAALAEAREAAVRAFAEPVVRVGAGAGLYPGHEHVELALDGPATFRVAIPAAGAYALFTQHHPDEFSAHLAGPDGTVLAASLERVFRPDHEHDDEVSSVGLVHDGPVDARRFNAWLSALLQERGPDIYRSKGVIAVDGDDHRVIFQGVHMLLDSERDRPWAPGEERRTQLVLIGRNLDRDELEAGFRACLA